MPPRIFPLWCLAIASHVAAADMTNIDGTNTWPAISCRREPLRKVMAAAPERSPANPPATWRNSIGESCMAAAPFRPAAASLSGQFLEHRDRIAVLWVQLNRFLVIRDRQRLVAAVHVSLG